MSPDPLSPSQRDAINARIAASADAEVSYYHRRRQEIDKHDQSVRFWRRFVAVCLVVILVLITAIIGWLSPRKTAIRKAVPASYMGDEYGREPLVTFARLETR